MLALALTPSPEGLVAEQSRNGYAFCFRFWKLGVYLRWNQSSEKPRPKKPV